MTMNIYMTIYVAIIAWIYYIAFVEYKNGKSDGYGLFIILIGAPIFILIYMCFLNACMDYGKGGFILGIGVGWFLYDGFVNY